jgi:hypothetical protein
LLAIAIYILFSVIYRNLWLRPNFVLPTNIPFFELDYPQKSPQCFASKTGFESNSEEAPLRTGCSAMPNIKIRAVALHLPASQFPSETRRLTKPIAIFWAPDSASVLQPSPTTQSPTSAVTAPSSPVTD